MADESTSDDGYSPLLAKMLQIDPEKISSVSLSALGRQALGSNTDEYKAAKAEVDAARDAMVKALTDRRTGPDPSTLALAQGFLAPTRTGSFGESLGAATGAYSKAQMEEEARLRDVAKMRYELARAGLSDEEAAAKLGLSVVSKLTPQLTAYQKQVRSEGIDPTSTEGITRIKELQAQDKATNEMKMFAARSGISITDPTFAAKFEASEKNKPLETIAVRLNLDLTNPIDLDKAQKALQIETFKKESPEIAKALDSFGGNPLNPKDLARAQQIVADTIRLEQEGKKATIESTRQQTVQSKEQTKRIQQEIAEHVRNQNTQAVAAKAVEVGVPMATTDRYAGLNQIETATKRKADQSEADKYIRDKVAPFMSGIDDDITNLKRALALNSEISTGVTYGLPGVGGVAKVMSGDRAKINEFDSLSALAAKQNRIPGDSNVSNLDVKMMQLGTFSSDKEPITNKTIIQYQLAQRERDRDYNNFITNYAAINGHIGPEAQAQWRRYLDANPITTRDPKGKVMLNPNRITYQQYFTMPRVRVGADGQERP
jgi:hypothetical protein